MLFFMTIENEEDRNKLTQLFEAYSSIMFKTAYSILKDRYEAEDAVQDAFIRLEKNIFKISQIRCNKTRAFLVTIVRNLAINAYNDRKKAIVITEEEIEAIPIVEELTVEGQFLQLERVEQIAKALAKINPSYAELIMMKYYRDLSNEEIAELTGVSESTVRVRISRAHKALLKVLVKGGITREKI